MVRIVISMLAATLFFIGCGSSDDSEGGLTRTNDYDTESLNFFDIRGGFTLQPNEGLNFSMTTQNAENITVYLYDMEGRLDSENVEIDSEGNFLSSYDTTTGNWVYCAFMNETAGQSYTFSVANTGSSEFTFKVVAYQTESNDGTASEPVELTIGTSYGSRVGDFGYSYYTFTKTSSSLTEISLIQTDAMTGADEELVWYVEDDSELGIYVTDADGNSSLICNDYYGDGNVSCSATLTAGTYSVNVSNRGDSPLTKYNILVTEE